MLEVKPVPRSSYYGDLFEAFVVSKLHRRIAYSEKQIRMIYMQTADGLEIDLLLEKSGKIVFAVEIKSKSSPTSDNFSALRRIADNFPHARRLSLCQETRPRQTEDGIEVLPWKEGIENTLNS